MNKDQLSLVCFCFIQTNLLMTMCYKIHSLTVGKLVVVVKYFMFIKKQKLELLHFYYFGYLLLNVLEKY